MQIILLIIALSVDLFLACVACGTEQIKIGNMAALCISGICSGVLFFALFAGTLIDGIVLEPYTGVFCFLVLFLVGSFKLSEYAIKRYIKKHTFLCKRVKVSFSQLNFILSIYNNPVMADKDHSATMSLVESVFFALAMSIDGLVGGMGAGFLQMNIYLTTICNFVAGFLAIRAGSMIGMHASSHRSMDISWIGGILFLLLAFGKIVS